MSSISASVLLARQPIFDRELGLFAYELLYRGVHPLESSMISGDSATCQVVMNALCGSDPSEYHGIPVFLNLTESMLLSESSPPLPTESVVFEVLESVRPSPLLFKNLLKLHQAGFRLALDDFVWNDDMRPAIDLAHFIKIDIRQYDAPALAALVKQLLPFNKILLAEKVETQEELTYCLDLGFQLFQGYFLERPQPVVGKKISPRLDLVMNIYTALQRESVTPHELSEYISQDPQLSFQLLRIINSAAFARQRKVQSLREAVMLLGLQQLRTWIMVIALADDASKPPELLQTLLVRARLCENIMRKSSAARADAAFLMGLFSGLDALLDIPLEVLVTRLPLAEDVQAALTHHEGDLGLLLKNAIAFERAQWQDFAPHKLSAEDWQQHYFAALKWANEVAVPLRS